MAVYIESRYNHGYLAHHASDVIMVSIIHRPQDGYLLSYDREVIKEQLPLRQFIERLIRAEDRNSSSLSAHGSKIESEIGRIEYGLRERKSRELCEWLDHRYANLIRLGELTLVQHHHSVIADRETVGNSERFIRQSQPLTEDQAWDAKKVLKEMDRQGLKIDESVTDEEVYYTMIK